MIAVITSIELRSPFKFFALSYNALQIIKQLKTSGSVAYKSTGFWTKHYTMSLWESEEAMKTFSRSGAHLAAMKKSGEMAVEIRVLRLETEQLPDWKTAKKQLLATGKILKF
jgi:hypothetical protein